ncbi:hypothetical protein A9Q99_19525 [Gammaproteobacteria bacterium 45_16_T64]|nr:hypothetical protein A9Q99_19525 [Gammaproteobacteria bacterium 45_16_T64]
MLSQRSTTIRLFFLLIISSTLLTACVSEEAPPTDNPHTFSIEAHADNTLMVEASVTTENSAQVTIQFTSMDTATHQTATSAIGKAHAFTVVGLRAETQYEFVAIITDENNDTIESEPQILTTGSLPADTPTIELLTKTDNSMGGITFFAEAASTGRFYGVDEDGIPVWYLHGDDISMSASPVIRAMEDGRLMLLLNREVRIINILGETLSSYTLPAYHHDAILLDSGNILALTYETGTFDNQTLTGDRIVELDPEGNTVWEWSSFEHLDTGRFPGTLASRENNGALDWTHSNALHHLSHDDTILLSSRSQSWVVNIDHGTGDIVWIMGNSEGAADNLQDKFFTLTNGSWMASQHAPMQTSLGDILIYDNRNEAELAGSRNNSRGVRFSLDTNNMTAEQNWEYVSPKYTQSLGDIDELENGNILLNSGGPGSSNDAHIIEVTADAIPEVTWELRVSDISVYRAERIRWENVLKTTARTPLDDSDDDADTTPPISDLIDIANCQEAINFVDTNNPDNYIDYDLNGNTNADLFGEALAPVLSVNCDIDTLFVNTNGATNFDWINLNGSTTPTAVDYRWTLPRNPTLTGEQISIPILGPIAITATGIQIFGPNENAADNYANPVTDGLLNYCGGHTRDYHFHERAKCFFEWPTMGGADSLLPNNTAGIVIGYALDGFPIMAPWECSNASCTETIKIESSYAYIGTGDYANENAWDYHSYQANLSPLDQCNGMTRPDGSYAYYATDGWPYYLACYKGPTHLVSDNNRLFR